MKTGIHNIEWRRDLDLAMLHVSYHGVELIIWLALAAIGKPLSSHTSSGFGPQEAVESIALMRRNRLSNSKPLMIAIAIK